MKVKSLFTGLALMSIAFHSVASLPNVVAERDIAPLGIACNEKVSATSISDSELISILRLHYSVNKEQAKRVVAMLNTIPDLHSKDCKDIDIKYTNHHNN